MLQSNKGFYRDHNITALTTSFQEINWNFNSVGIFLASDSGVIEYSINGTDVVGKLLANEKRDMPFRVFSKLYLRGAAGGEQYRLEVY